MKTIMTVAFLLMGTILWGKWTQATDPIPTSNPNNSINNTSPNSQTSSSMTTTPANSAAPQSSAPVSNAPIINPPPGSVTTITTTTTTIGPAPLTTPTPAPVQKQSTVMGPLPDKSIIEDKIIRPGVEGSSLIIQSEIQNKNETARASIQDYMNIRDPFKSPEIQSTVQGNVSQLEKYIVTEYKLTGVMTGPNRMRAMIQTPDGKTHFISEGIKLGNRGGIVKKITTKSIIVRERSVNALGEEEFTTTEIVMTPDSNSLAGK